MSDGKADALFMREGGADPPSIVLPENLRFDALEWLRCPEKRRHIAIRIGSRLDRRKFKAAVVVGLRPSPPRPLSRCAPTMLTALAHQFDRECSAQMPSMRRSRRENSKPVALPVS